MSIGAETRSAQEIECKTVEPIPTVVPGEFVVRLGAGWGGPLHDLANGLAVWRDGPTAATGVLLSCLEYVMIEIEGVDECRGLLKGLELIRGAVMTAGIEAAGVGRSNRKYSGAGHRSKT